MQQRLLTLSAAFGLSFLAACSSSSTTVVDDHDSGPNPGDSGGGMQKDSGQGKDSGSGGDDATDQDGSQGDDAGDDSGEDASDDAGDDAADDASDDAGDDAGSTICSAGTLYAGDPTYNGDPGDAPTSGTGILADPPFQWQNLVFAGTELYSRNEGELWGVDLSASSKVETKIAGLNDDSGYSYSAGPCASALFAQIRGLATLSDGSVIVSDILGNGILKVTNPTKSTCTVAYLAGNATPTTDGSLDPSSDLPNVGDQDGTGAGAKFNGPWSIEADSADNVYVYDSGNMKVKKVTPAGVVTTLGGVLPGDGTNNILNLTHIGTKLYGVAVDALHSHVYAIDTTSGAITAVLEGDGSKFPPLDENTFPQIDGIANDGTNLYIAGNGYVWYLTLAGKLTLVAGVGIDPDFPPSGYDPAKSHPALSLELQPSTDSFDEIGSDDDISFFNGALYFRGQGNGTASYVEKIACP